VTHIRRRRKRRRSRKGKRKKEELHTTATLGSAHVHRKVLMYEGWNFNSGNYLFTTDTK